MRRTRLLGIVSILSGLLCAACSGAPDVDPDAAISSRSQPGLHVQAPAATRARERLTPVSPAMPAPEAAMPRKAYLVSSRATFREFSGLRSEEHTSELQSLMRISYAVFCLKKKTILTINVTIL